MKQEESLVKVSNELVRSSSVKHESLRRVMNDMVKDTQLIPYRKGGLWGYCDSHKNIMIPCHYYDAKPFRFELAIVKVPNTNHKYSVLNRFGEMICNRMYGLIDDFSEGFARVWNDNHSGYIDIHGNEIVPLKYRTGWKYKNGFAPVSTGKPELHGYLNRSGQLAIHHQYFRAHWFSDGLAHVHYPKQLFDNGAILIAGIQDHGFINELGEEVLSRRFDAAFSFQEGLAAVKVNGEWCFIDQKGKIAIPPFGGFLAGDYSKARGFSQGLCPIRINNKCGFIDQSGSVVIPPKYDEVLEFSEGLAGIRIGGKWGFVDKNGYEVIPFSFDKVWNFSEGFAKVKLNDLFGYINDVGEEVISKKYSSDNSWEIESFSGGFAKVKYKYFPGYIDKNGIEYWED